MAEGNSSVRNDGDNLTFPTFEMDFDDVSVVPGGMNIEWAASLAPQDDIELVKSFDVMDFVNFETVTTWSYGFMI